MRQNTSYKELTRNVKDEISSFKVPGIAGTHQNTPSEAYKSRFERWDLIFQGSRQRRKGSTHTHTHCITYRNEVWHMRNLLPRPPSAQECIKTYHIEHRKKAWKMRSHLSKFPAGQECINTHLIKRRNQAWKVRFHISMLPAVQECIQTRRNIIIFKQKDW